MERLSIVRPCSFTAALSVLHNGRLLIGQNRMAASLQAATSDLTGFANPAGELVALAGFLPLDDGGFEFWFELGPGARDHVRGLVRIARLTLPAVAHHAPVHAHVRAGYEPGRRLAKLAGFLFAGAVHGFERWEFPNGRDRENVLGQGGAPDGAGLGRRRRGAQG